MEIELESCEAIIEKEKWSYSLHSLECIGSIEAKKYVGNFSIILWKLGDDDRVEKL
jgi:hypothetical protein